MGPHRRLTHRAADTPVGASGPESGLQLHPGRPLRSLGFPTCAGLGRTAGTGPLGKGGRGVGLPGPSPTPAPALHIQRVLGFHLNVRVAPRRHRAEEPRAERPGLAARSAALPRLPAPRRREEGASGALGSSVVGLITGFQPRAGGRASGGRGRLRTLSFSSVCGLFRGGIQTCSPHAAEWTVVAPA